MSNGVYTRRDGPHRTVVSTSFDDTLYAPEMDDMLEDRLEEARQNRTGFYRKMLASRSRPLDDYSVSSRRTTYRNGGSPVKEPSISDTVQSGPLPQIPEPHSSWRFYTSYDNGEWKRHAVPVHKEEEEILREPTKVVRRTRETHSPPGVESSLRKMRQGGGPLVACLQPRPRRSSEGQRTTTTTLQSVNGQPLGVGGEFGGDFGGQFGGMLPEEWEKMCANGSVVRRFSDGGTEYLVLQEEPIQGSMKQECTTKYTSTVKVTQPKGGGHHVRSGLAIEQGKGGVAAGVGVEAGQGLVKGEKASVRRSSRPRIYGFQEKIIIPTKYKNMENDGNGNEGQKENDINTGQLKTREETTVKKSSLVEDGVRGNERRVGVGEAGGGGGRIQGKEESQNVVVRHLKPGSTALDRSMEGKTVKVVVMNSGSDVESDRKSSEPISSGEENEAKDSSTAARKSNAGISESFIQMPNLFQDGPFPMEGIRALHESLHAKLLPPGVALVKEDQAGSVSAIEEDKSLVPNQRVFSKDEETFSEVGPGGAKCDGKVLRTYEVITTGDDDDDDVPVENKPLPTTTKEVIIVPIEAGNQRSPFLKTRAIASSAQEDRTIKSNTREQSHFPSEQETLSPPPPRKTIPAVSPKADDKKATTDIFEQTGSLFKTITARPRNIREKDSSSVFAAREEHLRKAAAGESVHPKLGSVTSRTIRISSNHQDDLKPEFDAFERGFSGRVGTGVSGRVGTSVSPVRTKIEYSGDSPVRTKVEYVSTTENRSSSQPRPSGPAEGKALVVRDSFGASAATEDGGGLSQPNTNSGVRLQQGWSSQTQTTKSNPRTGQMERDWEVQVALKE